MFPEAVRQSVAATPLGEFLANRPRCTFSVHFFGRFRRIKHLVAVLFAR